MSKLIKILSMMTAGFCGHFALAAPTLPPTREERPNQLDWITLTDADSRHLFGDEELTLPPDHPLASRLQSWVDLLYARLMELYPERMRDESGRPLVPPPHMRLVISPKPEAHTSAATVCYQIPVYFAGAPSDLPFNSEFLAQINDRGGVGVVARARTACVDRMAQPADAHAVRRLIGDVDCAVNIDQGSLVIGKNCKLPAELQFKGVGGIILRSVADQVSLSVGLYRALPSEGALLFTLLHELAHYFRSHAVVRKSRYQYFYRRSGKDEFLQQPSPDPTLDSLGAQLLQLPRFRTQPVTGQRWHSEMYSYGRYAMTALVAPNCLDASASCHVPCAPWLALMTDEVKTSSLGRFPQAVLRGQGLAAYFEWEATFTSCLAAIDGSTLNRDTVQKVFWRADLPTSPSPSWHLLDAAESMNQKLIAQSAAQDAVLMKALTSRVGYYTTEEEADNLALTWLPLLGFSSQDAFDHWWAFATYYDGSTLESELNFGRDLCRRLFDAQPRWTESGRYVPVPIGSFADPHHSICYRIWNLDQRAPHVSTPLLPASMEAVSFATIQDLANEILRQPGQRPQNNGAQIRYSIDHW